MRTFVYKVSIHGAHPPVWRRITVPENRTLGELHEILQVVFDWDDMHLHEFSTAQGLVGRVQESLFYGSTESEFDEASFPISEAGSKFVYTYDFGDNWEHVITLEKILEEENLHPRVIKWKGDNFVEDCGGVWMANEAIAMLQEKEDPQEAGDEEDAFEDEWDEEMEVINPFDLEETNRRLERL